MEKRTRTLLLVASAAGIAAAAAFLLLRTDPDDGGGAAQAPPRGRPGGTDGASAPPRAARSPSAAPEGGPEPPAGAAGTPRLEVRAEVEGGFGLAEVLVLPLVRDADGEIGAWLGEEAPEGGSTGADGCITIRYKSEPAERLFGFLEDRELVAAENATSVGNLHRFKVFRAVTAAPVTLHFKDPESLVLLRPVDAAMGEVLSGRRGIAFTWTPPEEEGMTGQCETGLREKEPGWLEVPGRASGPVSVLLALDPGHRSMPLRDLRLLVPGYRPAAAPAGGWKGRVVVPLEPDPAAVRGTIVVPKGWEASAVLLRPSGNEIRSMELVGVPQGPGPFAMSGFPLGESDLVILAWENGRSAEDTLWATVRIDFRGAGLDLGELRPLPGGVVRARLLSREGRPVTDAPLLLAQAVPGEIPELTYTRTGGSCGASVSFGRGFVGSGPGPRDPGEDGWVEFRGLRPGATFLLATPRIPGLTRVVEAPGKPGETVSVELDGGCRMTACTLRFTVGGEEPGTWRGFSGPAYTDAFSTGKGILEADIPPGRYRFVAAAEVGPDSDYQVLRTEVEIPDTGSFDATVDLKPPRR